MFCWKRVAASCWRKSPRSYPPRSAHRATLPRFH